MPLTWADERETRMNSNRQSGIRTAGGAWPGGITGGSPLLCSAAKRPPPVPRTHPVRLASGTAFGSMVHYG